MICFPPLQSAYCPKHSTETALLKVLDDAYVAADDGKVTLVVLLDFSAAFDTVVEVNMDNGITSGFASEWVELWL